MNNNNSLSNNKYSFKNKYKNKKPLEEYIYYYNKEYIEGKCWFKYSKLKSNKINNNSSNNTTNYNKNSSKNNKQDKSSKALIITLNTSKKVYKKIYNKPIYNRKSIIIFTKNKKIIIKNSSFILDLKASKYYISNKK